MRLAWWVVPAVVAGMLAVSYAAAKTVRFPTQTLVVEGRAVSPGVRPEAVEFTVEGLKCWTMSGLFTQRMAEEPGVLEVTTFVRTHTARIAFDPSVTSPERLAEAAGQPLTNPETGETRRLFHVKAVRRP